MRGVIIAESLKDQSILKELLVVDKKIEIVAERHQTPWLNRWTLYTVEIPDNQVESIAKKISESLVDDHEWYADFKDNFNHYIIFKNKIFLVNRRSQSEYDEVKKYGVSLGIPDYQVSFKALNIKH